MTKNDDFQEVLAGVAELGDSLSEARPFRLDVYLFFSFDLVGSTKLKAQSFPGFDWIDVIRHFYSRCENLVETLGVQNAIVWKYIGDEVVFYQIVHKSQDIERSVSAIFRCLQTFELELQSSKYAEASPFISIKAVAWLSPIKSYVDDLDAKLAQRYIQLDETFTGDDQLVDDRDSVDFLGPNIDAGFRLATFARRKQLVISLALAAYLVDADSRANDLRIVAFESLKGVAANALYPGIWFHENWSNIRDAFPYEERHGDALIRAVCAGQFEPLNTLEEVRKSFSQYGYTFNKELIDEIIKLSAGRCC